MAESTSRLSASFLPTIALPPPEPPSWTKRQFTQSVLQPAQEYIETLTAVPHPLLFAITQALTTLYNTLRETETSSRDEVLEAISRAKEALSKIRALKNPENVYTSTLLEKSSEKATYAARFHERTLSLYEDLLSYETALNDPSDVMEKDHLRMRRHHLLSLLAHDLSFDRESLQRGAPVDPVVNTFDPEKLPLPSLEEGEEPWLATHISDRYGILITLQALYYQNRGTLLRQLDKARGIGLTYFTHYQKKVEKVVAAVLPATEQAVYDRDTPLYTILSGERAIIEEITQHAAPFSDAPLPSLEVPEDHPFSGFLGWCLSAVNLLSNNLSLLRTSIAPGLLLLKATRALSENKEETKLSINRMETLLQAIQRGSISHPASIRLAFREIFSLAEKHVIWIGNVVNLDPFSRNTEEVQSTIEDLRHLMQEKKRLFPTGDPLQNHINYEPLCDGAMKEAEVVCIAKTVHRVVAWFIRSSSKEESEFSVVFRNAEGVSSKPLRENLISHLQKMVTTSSLWFPFRIAIYICVRPLFWIVELGIGNVFYKIKESVMALIGRTEKSSLNKDTLIIAPLKTFTRVTTDLYHIHDLYAKHRPCNDVKTACTNYFADNLSSLSLNMGNKLVDNYLFQFKPSEKLSSTRQAISTWISQFRLFAVRALLRVFVTVPIHLILWPIETFLLKPIQFTLNITLKWITKRILKRTNAVHEIVLAMSTSFRSPVDSATSKKETVHPAVLWTDQVKIEILEALIQEIDGGDSPDTHFASLQISEETESAMHDFLLNLLTAIEASEEKTPTQATDSSKSGHAALLTRLLKWFFGADQVHGKVAECLEKLLTKGYYTLMQPKILTKLLYFALTSIKKTLTESSHQISTLQMQQEHERNHEKIAFLKILFLKKAIFALQEQESIHPDSILENHARALKRWLLPKETHEPLRMTRASPLPPDISRSSNLLHRWQEELTLILTTPIEKTKVTAMLAQMSREIDSLYAMLTERVFVLSSQEHAGEGSLGVYQERLNPILQQLTAFIREFNVLYDAYLELSIPEEHREVLLTIVELIPSYVQQMHHLVSLDPLDLRAAALLSSERMKLKRDLEICFRELTKINTAYPGRRDLVRLLPWLKIILDSVSNLEESTKEYISFNDHLQKWRYPPSNSPKGAPEELSIVLKSYKDPYLFERAIQHVFIPILQRLFPEHKKGDADYTCIVSHLQEIKSYLTQSNKRDEAIGELVSKMDSVLKAKQEAILAKNRALTRPLEYLESETMLCMSHYKETIDTMDLIHREREPFLERRERSTQALREARPLVQRELSLSEASAFVPPLHVVRESGVGALPIRVRPFDILEHLRGLRESTRSLDPRIESVHIPLTPLMKPLGNHLIPEITHLLDQLSLLFLQQGPFIGAIKYGIMEPFLGLSKTVNYIGNLQRRSV